MDENPQTRNRAKDKIREGEVALGLISRIVRSPEIALIAKRSGHDFLFLDSQHSALDLQTISAVSIAAAAAGVAPLVRVRGYDDPDMSLLLDGGAMGVVVPDVANAEQARAVVRATRFPPDGARSFAGPTLGLAYAAVSPGEAAQRLNEDTLVVCMIETPEGLKNAAEIAAVDGVDVLHIGCGDLLMAMGRPGEFASDEIAAAVRHVIAACKEHGKAAGFGGDRDRDRQRRYIDEGVRFVTTQADVALLLAGASQGVRELRG